MAEFVFAEQDGAVAVITIDHPPVNALSAPLLEELEAEIERLDADDGVRAIVLRGAGERAFVAGADISEFPSLRAAADEAHEARRAESRSSATGWTRLTRRSSPRSTASASAAGSSSRCAATSGSRRRARSSASPRSSSGSFREVEGRSACRASSGSVVLSS